MSDEQRPSVDPIAKRLGALDRTPAMASAAKENPQIVEDVIFKGFDALINRFNRTDPDGVDREFIPKVVALKNKLNGSPLPTITELGSRDLVRGVKEAARFMELGQDIKHGTMPIKVKGMAIGTPSIETNDIALVVGTAGHILERTVFNYFREAGIGEWTKDEVLFALEDLALLQHAEAITGQGEDSPLFRYMTQPASMSEDGGLGWRSKEQVESVVKRYKELHEARVVKTEGQS